MISSMSLKVLSKSAEYVKPAWIPLPNPITDGIYLDEGLFKENPPIHYAAIGVIATPKAADACARGLIIRITTYDGNAVGILPIAENVWAPFTRGTYEKTTVLKDNGIDLLYGIGLNMLQVIMTTLPEGYPRDVRFSVDYALEVHYG